MYRENLPTLVLVIWDLVRAALVIPTYPLILLAKIVRMEADIRTAQAELDTVRMMVENKRGTQIPNPMISVIYTLERRLLAVIRSMSLNQTASHPRTLNGTAKVAGEARAALKVVCVEGLIARPAH